MKRNLRRGTFGFTFVGLLVVVTVCALLFCASILLGNAKNRAIRMCCINSLKQTQIAFDVWAGDNGGKFPMSVPDESGGALESTVGGNVSRCFQVMSNELSTTIVTYCPADTRRNATNFTNFKNENVSFFVGLDANKSESNPQAWLCGDRNITNGIAPNHTLVTLKTWQSAGWDEKLHNRCGNVAMMDGSVHQLSNADLRRMLRETRGWTNRLALPE